MTVARSFGVEGELSNVVIAKYGNPVGLCLFFRYHDIPRFIALSDWLNASKLFFSLDLVRSELSGVLTNFRLIVITPALVHVCCLWLLTISNTRLLVVTNAWYVVELSLDCGDFSLW